MRNNLVKLYKAQKVIKKAQDIPEKLGSQSFSICLKQVGLTNFRNFKQLNIELHPQLTVFIGNNGAGKTAILDAIALGFGPVLTYLPESSGIRLKESDLQIGARNKKAPFARIQVETTNNNLNWDITKERDNSRTTSKEIPKGIGIKPLKAFLEPLIDRINQEKPATLPLLVYYGTNTKSS